MFCLIVNFTVEIVAGIDECSGAPSQHRGHVVFVADIDVPLPDIVLFPQVMGFAEGLHDHRSVFLRNTPCVLPVTVGIEPPDGQIDDRRPRIGIRPLVVVVIRFVLAYGDSVFEL